MEAVPCIPVQIHPIGASARLRIELLIRKTYSEMRATACTHRCPTCRSLFQFAPFMIPGNTRGGEVTCRTQTLGEGRHRSSVWDTAVLPHLYMFDSEQTSFALRGFGSHWSKMLTYGEGTVTC